MSKHRLLFLCVLFMAGLVLTITVIAQDGDTCPALVEQALQAVGDNCGDLSRNAACYGFNRVDATFTEPVDADFFSEPADTAGLTTVQTIQTAALDPATETWGVAVMSVQANVPNTLPGQAVIFMLIGDARVENAVAPDAAFAPAEDPIAITVIAAAANIRSFPSPNANVLGTAADGTAFETDGRSANGEWYRIIFNDGPAWINRAVIGQTDGLADLPVISDSNRSPMQAFYFNTGAGQPQCNEAPNSIVIQGPGNVVVDLNVNGADITIGSTIALIDNGDGTIQLYVLDGGAQIGELIIPAGFTITASIDEDGNIIPGSWTALRPMTADELMQFESLENVDATILNYPIRIPTIEEISRTLAAISGGGGGTVQGGTGQSAVRQVNCRGFAPTSPIGRLPYEVVTFYWNPANGATHYRLNIYAGGSNSVVGSFIVDAPSTSFSVDSGGLGGGPEFSWDVTALYNGEAACTTGRATLVRDNPPEGSTQADFMATISCSGSSYVISWANAQPGEAVTISFSDTSFGVFFHVGMGPSGSKSFPSFGYPTAGGSITTASGDFHPVAAGVSCP